MACAGCFEKQIKIDGLEKRIVPLEYKLRRQKLKNHEGYFGSSTPSSKIPIKENPPLIPFPKGELKEVQLNHITTGD